jgi:ABC-2 type transport system ATP-binding protein
MSIALEVERLGKRFGNREILQGVSLSIASGEFVGLIGLNGAGKTTFFKCLLDLCDIDGGDIRIFGLKHSLPQARQSVCFFPERFVCPGFSTGREFLAYTQRLRQHRYEPQKVSAMLDALDLPPMALDLRATSLSKGTAQKLGLAATMLADPSFLVMDEPMSGLDPKARALLKRHLISKRTSGLTLLFSTHMLADLNELCDRIVVLHQGRLRFVGTTAQLVEEFGGDSLEDAYLACVSE